MKHLLAIFFVIAALTGAAQPRVQWLSETIDFGAFREESGPATAIFRGINTGTSPLVVLAARANCGCTTPVYQTVAYAPGDTLEVAVTYDPKGRPGRFKKYVYVDTNTDPERSKLTIKGVVIGEASTVSGRYPVEVGPMRLAAPAVLLGKVTKGHVKSVFLGLYNASVDSIAPVVTDLPKWLEVTVAPPSVGPGEQASFNFFVKSDRTPLYGVVTDTVTVYPDAANRSVSLRLPVVATLEEDFSRLTDAELARSPQVYFPDGQRVALAGDELSQHSNGRGEITVQFTVKNVGKSPLLVRRIQTTDAGVTAAISATKIKPGKSTQLSVTVPADLVGKAFTTRVLLITNDPTDPVSTLRVALGR